MIPGISHPVTPFHLAVFEEELATDLPVVTALEGASSRFEALINGANHGRGERVLHVFRAFGTEAHGTDHAQLCVEFLGWVGVDGIRAAGFSHIHGDEVGLAAADDDDLGRDGEGLESIGGYGGRKATEVFLTVLVGSDVSQRNPHAG